MDIAVSYARVSTNKEEQKESLKAQKEFFKDYVERHGMVMNKIYADEGISGTKTKNRKEFLQMMQDARQGKFQVLLVKDVSRIARNTFDFLKCIRELRDLNIKVVYMSYGGDVFEGELVVTIMAAIAQEESHNLSRRVKFGKKAGKEKGKVPNIVYGYDKVKNDKYALEVNEDEAEMVKEIFDMYTFENKGASKIAIELNSRGFLTKRGCSWSQNAVTRILRNEIYIGKIYNGKEEVTDFLSGKREKKGKEDWYVREYPELKIISNEQFAEAQRILGKRGEDFKLYNKKEANKYIFSTLIKCKTCGRSFRRIERKDCREPWYTCYNRNEKGVGMCANKTKVFERELIEELQTFFSEFIKNKESEIIKYAREIKKIYDNDEASKYEIMEIENKIDELKSEREIEIQMAKRGIIGIDELENRVKPIANKIEQLEKRKAQYTYNNYSVEDIAKVLRKEYKKIEDLAKGENYTNEMLKRVLSRVEVGEDGSVDIYIKPFEEIGLMENCRFSDDRT